MAPTGSVPEPLSMAHRWQLTPMGCPPPCLPPQWRPVEGGLRNAVELVRLIREEHGALEQRPGMCTC